MVCPQKISRSLSLPEQTSSSVKTAMEIHPHFHFIFRSIQIRAPVKRSMKISMPITCVFIVMPVNGISACMMSEVPKGRRQA